MALQGKQALLAWCQQETAYSTAVSVTNFSSSWQDGLAFTALIHSTWPSKIPHPDTLDAADKVANVNRALAAGEAVGIFPLLDAEMTATMKPDSKSVMTYLTEVRKAAKGAKARGLRTNSVPAMSASTAAADGGGGVEDDVASLLGGMDIATGQSSSAKAVSARPQAATGPPPAIPKGGKGKKPPPIPKGNAKRAALGAVPDQPSPKPARPLPEPKANVSEDV